jgi:hypothetical protein
MSCPFRKETLFDFFVLMNYAGEQYIVVNGNFYPDSFLFTFTSINNQNYGWP